MNPHGFKPDNEEKLEYMKHSIVKYQINVILLSLLDYKQISIMTDSIESKLKQVHYKLELYITDSTDHSNVKSNYLPGRTISARWCEITKYINK